MTHFGIIADIQLQGKGLAEAGACLKWAAAILQEQRVDAVLLPGDIFERDQLGDRTRQTGGVADVFYEFLEELREIPVHAVSGNHDRFGIARDSALKTIRYPNFFLHDTTTPANMDRVSWPHTCVFFLNWIYPPSPQWLAQEFERMLPLLDELRSRSSADIAFVLCAHGQVVGAIQNGGHACDGGVSILPREFLSKFDYLALGDFHLRQEILPGRGGFVGALFQQDIGEEDDPCGIETVQVGPCEDKPLQIVSTWHECPVARRYKTMLVTSPDQAKELLSLDLSHTSLRVQYPFDGTPEAVNLRAVLTPFIAQGIKLVPIRPKTERTLRTNGKLERVDSPTCALEFWIHEKNVPKEEAELLRECLALVGV